MSAAASDSSHTAQFTGRQFDEVLAFVEVARWLSFAKAATTLEMPPSVISRRVSNLEKRHAAQLFIRTTRRVELTEAGALFLAKCENALGEMHEAQTALSMLLQSPRGRLRISMPSAFGRLCVAPLLSAFVDAYPEIELDIQLADHFVDMVRDRVDLAIRIGDLGDSDLVAKPFLNNRRFLVAAPALLRRIGVPRHPDDLTAMPCLRFSNLAPRDVWHLARGEERASVVASGPIRANDPDTILQAVTAGLGIAKVGEFAVYRQLAAGSLVRVLDGWEAAATRVQFVYPARRALPPKVQVFMTFIEHAMQREMPWAKIERPAPSMLGRGKLEQNLSNQPESAMLAKEPVAKRRISTKAKRISQHSNERDARKRKK
jgi:DNA-binding transcriptional LysR family regulator